MKCKADRGPSSAQLTTQIESSPFRAVANMEQEEERNIRAVSETKESETKEEEQLRGVEMSEEERNVVAVDDERPVKSVEKEQIPPRLAGNAFKTECDVKIHPDDQKWAYSGSSAWLRIVGNGTPGIVPVGSVAASQGPCVNQVYTTHEDVHVKNASSYCAAFKKCIEGKYGIVSKTVYYRDFVSCYTMNHGGLHPNCKKDEQMAYAASAAEAKKRAADPKCAKEKSLLSKAAVDHAGYAVTPPNC